MATITPDAPTAEGSSKTPAQIMQEKADAEEHHHAFVEEVVDEEDIEHPPPSLPTPANGDDAEDGTEETTNGAMSAKAAGKQKATGKPATLDTQSDEAFPALGAGPKPSAPASQKPGWVANAALRTAPNGSKPSSRPASSGVPTPSSTPGFMTPTAGGRNNISLPGRGQDVLEIDSKDLDRSKNIRGILDTVKRRYGVTVTPSEMAGKTRLVAEGPKGKVTEALMVVSKELTTEQTIKVEIPSAVSPQIIGKGGSNIKQLEGQFNVRIQIKRSSETAPSGAEDLRSDVVEITGHAAQVRQVHEKILNRVKELQPKVDLPVRAIPPELYPFIAGRHAAQIQQMEQDNDLRIQVPPFYRRQQMPPARQPNEPLFMPHGDSHIVVSGEQAEAMQARMALEQLAQQLQAELILEELASEQILHPYVVGDRGMDPLEFLERTGCAIILPPPGEDTDDIHIIGPQDRIGEGRALAEELMSKKHNRTVDMRKHFADAPSGHDRHSRALAQYLQQKAIEREFKDAHNAEIVFPTAGNGLSDWTVITDDPQKAMSARNDLAKITQAFPASRLGLVDVDPFYHPHLHERHAQGLRNDFGVHMIVPDNEEDPITLVFEGPVEDSPAALPRNRPSPADVKAFEQALQQAQAQLLGGIPQQPISQKNVGVPRK